jgi:UDP-N-acetylmuramoyl-L-alanyl-D-glutamate--2,6-diaminopimelate ligase
MAKLYETIAKIPHEKIVHVLGSTGGGRDKVRRPKLGKLAGEKADYIIVTNEDPYGESPVSIINQVFSGVVGYDVNSELPNFQFPISNSQSNPNNQNLKIKKTDGLNCWRILDRREAIKKALAMVGQKDIILVTGKGSEQAMCVADGKKIPWDDRKVIRELLQEAR